MCCLFIVVVVVVVSDADIQEMCMFTPTEHQLANPGAKSPGSKTLGDAGTRESSTNGRSPKNTAFLL